MLVKVYKGLGPGNGFSRRAGMHRLMRTVDFLAETHLRRESLSVLRQTTSGISFNG